MCEVTRHNFNKLFSEVEYNLKKSTFIAIDCEFSGLISKADIKNSLFDGGPERYRKLKESVDQIIVLQVGISAFRYIRDVNEYNATVYNFYICPRSFGPIDPRFLCQSSSFEFLCSYNFNFNKVIYDGISYLNCPQKELLQKQLRSGVLFSNFQRAVSLDDEKLIQDGCSKVAKWATSNPSEDTFSIPLTTNRESLCYMLQQEIRHRFNNLWTYSEDSKIVVQRVTEERRRDLIASTCLEEQFIDDLSGFTKIFELMSALKKPIVGHNLFLDLLIMYNQFQNPLPNSLKTFKKAINGLFPLIYDTKYISYEFQNTLKNEERFGSNSLGNLYDFFKGKGSMTVLYPPRIRLQPGLYEEVNDQQIHEAGWDSYITGFCFIKMAHILAAKSENCVQLRPLTSLEHLAAVTNMRNKVNIVRATLSHLNLEGDDPPSTRPPLLFVSVKGRVKLTKSYLVETFAKYGAADVLPLGNSTALVAVSNFSSVRDIVRDFRQHTLLKVEKYRFIKHSVMMKYFLWAGVVVPLGLTSCIVVYNCIKR